MTPAEQFRKLAALGLTTEQIAGVLEIIEADNEVRKAKGRERWHKWNDKKAGANVSQRLPTTANVNSQLASDPAPVEDNLPPKEIIGKEGKKEKNKTRAEHLADFKAELSDLDAERLEALIEHRRTKNGALTGHAAKLLRRDGAAVGMSISETVDTCISRGWLTVKPEYLASRSRPNGHAPPQGDTITDAVNRRIARGTYTNGHDRESQGNREVARELPADEGQQRRVAGLISGAVKSFQ